MPASRKGDSIFDPYRKPQKWKGLNLKNIGCVSRRLADCWWEALEDLVVKARHGLAHNCLCVINATTIKL